MTLFRPHRRLLDDAMAEVVDLPDFAALVAHLSKIYDLCLPDGVTAYSPDQVSVFKYGGFDERIGWDTYMVTIDGAARGFTNGPMERP